MYSLGFPTDIQYNRGKVQGPFGFMRNCVSGQQHDVFSFQYKLLLAYCTLCKAVVTVGWDKSKQSDFKIVGLFFVKVIAKIEYNITVPQQEASKETKSNSLFIHLAKK